MTDYGAVPSLPQWARPGISYEHDRLRLRLARFEQDLSETDVIVSLNPDTARRQRVEKLLVQALRKSTVDWRTPLSLAAEIDEPVWVVNDALRALKSTVRHPVRPRAGEENWVRLSSASYTWQEKVRIALSILARRP